MATNTPAVDQRLIALRDVAKTDLEKKRELFNEWMTQGMNFAYTIDTHAINIVRAETLYSLYADAVDHGLARTVQHAVATIQNRSQPVNLLSSGVQQEVRNTTSAWVTGLAYNRDLAPVLPEMILAAYGIQADEGCSLTR